VIGNDFLVCGSVKQKLKVVVVGAVVASVAVVMKKALRETQTRCAAYAGGSVFHRCIKLEADSSIRSKVIRGGSKISKLSHVTQATPT